MKRSYDSISLDVGYTFEDVFRLYYKRVRFFAYQMLHDIDLAEDVVQENLSSSIYQNPGWKIETSSLPEGD